MSYFFPTKSKNSKTGLLTSTSSSNTCPHTCPLRSKGCYARHGNLGRVWAKVDSGEFRTPLHQFLQRIRDLPEGTLWRHNQAGDLPGPGNVIDAIDLKFIVDANKGRRGFTYTHKPLNKMGRPFPAIPPEPGERGNLATEYPLPFTLHH